MDFFLFQKYGLNHNETNAAVIENALEKFRLSQDWETKLKSKNDRIRSRAKDEQQRWEEDRNLLLEPQARRRYFEEYNSAAQSIVEYILDNEGNDNAFAEIAAIHGIDADTARKVFESARDSRPTDGPAPVEAQELAFCINAAQNAFHALEAKLDEIIKSKFAERGIDFSSLYEVLQMESSVAAGEMYARATEISKCAYELYNNQLFSSDIKNMIMDLFDPKSTKTDSVFSFLKNEQLHKYFCYNKWVLIKYIRTTCMLMKKSGKVSEEKINNIPRCDRADFAAAMNIVFKITIEVSKQESGSFGSVSYELPEELQKAEKALQIGAFENAMRLFQKAADKSPYCWQAYWGLFKASIHAKTDQDIYFPGFLALLRSADHETDLPDFVDYYKAAKYNATAQRAAEINFATIEIEFKKADEVQNKHAENVLALKEQYERAVPSAIPSEQGRQAAEKLLNRIEKYKKTSEYSKRDIAATYFGLMMICMALIFLRGIGLRFISDTVPLVIMLVEFVAAGILVWWVSGVVLLGVGMAILMFLIFGVIEEVLIEIPVIGPIMTIVIAVCGVGLFVLGLKKLNITRRIRKNDSKELAEIQQLSQGLTDALYADIAAFYKSPLFVKYHIPQIEELDFSFANYYAGYIGYAED